MNREIALRYIAMPMAIQVFKQDKESFRVSKVSVIYQDMIDNVLERLEGDFLQLKADMYSKFHLDVRYLGKENGNVIYTINNKGIEFSPHRRYLIRRVIGRRLHMVALLTITFTIFILDQIINRSLIKKGIVRGEDSEKIYVNKTHKYGEKIIYWTGIVMMSISITQWPHLRMWVLFNLVVLFAFRTIMEWIYLRQTKTYLLSTVTCVLSIMGTVIYIII